MAMANCGVDSNGSGAKRIEKAHRAVLLLAVGPPPTADHEAAHRPVVCHNRGCVNPRHLEWKTGCQNSADKLLDGTDNRGEKHHQAKLTPEQVYAIRSDPRPNVLIAFEYGITPTHVGAIKKRRVWRHLPERPVLVSVVVTVPVHSEGVAVEGVVAA